MRQDKMREEMIREARKSSLEKSLVFILVLLILSSGGLLVSQTLAAPDAAERQPALLLRGPHYMRGLPFFDKNSIPVWQGVYGFDNKEIFAYYSETQLTLPAYWEPYICRGLVFLSRDYENGRVYALENHQQRTLFVHFPDPEFPVDDFLTVFFNRLNYFAGVSSVFSFPAVLNF